MISLRKNTMTKFLNKNNSLSLFISDLIDFPNLFPPSLFFWKTQPPKYTLCCIKKKKRVGQKGDTDQLSTTYCCVISTKSNSMLSLGSQKDMQWCDQHTFLSVLECIYCIIGVTPSYGDKAVSRLLSVPCQVSCGGQWAHFASHQPSSCLIIY